MNPKLVVCINKVVGSLTLNKKYSAYDENKQRNLFLIQDDDYDLIWRPKNEFKELDIKSL